MIELKRHRIEITFPEVDSRARLTIIFQRTLRIPDDSRTYPLPPGLGHFPLRHVDDFAARVPAHWVEHGGVMLPMYQAEAMWLRFGGTVLPAHRTAYPFAIKVAAGKINAVTGQTWSDGLHHQPQDYLVSPRQPWLDGYCVSKGLVRQFVAMPLGQGYTAEEQLTGSAEHGGLQLWVCPMKREAFERRFPPQPLRWERGRKFRKHSTESLTVVSRAKPVEMGLAPGGRMRQEIYKDNFDPDDWDLNHSSRCFVHLVNSQVWRLITGQRPPTRPPSAKQYSQAGLPWFDYYGDGEAVQGSATLQNVQSVAEVEMATGQTALPENESCAPKVVVSYHDLGTKHRVREGSF